MRVLLANKFYYRRGGDCVYAIELENLLKSAGHEVAFFSMTYPENLESPWNSYWPSEVALMKSVLPGWSFARLKNQSVTGIVTE